MEHQIFGQDKHRRIVGYRTKAIGQLPIDHLNGFEYYATITNDHGVL